MWCFSESVELSKVKLLIDDEMVISAFIDQDRPDVVKAYKLQENMVLYFDASKPRSYIL